MQWSERSLADLVLTRPPAAGRRSFGRAVVYGAVSTAMTLLLIPGLISPYPVLGPDGHMRASLSHAVNIAFCGSTKLSDTYDIPALLTEHPAELFSSISRVIDQRCGSIETYCRTLRRPRIDNENSLMWLMRAILFVNPRVSTAGIGQALAVLRLGILILLVVALSRAGVSLFATSGVAAMVGGVLWNLRLYQYHYVPFVLTLPLLLIGVYILLLDRTTWSTASVAAAFTTVGAMTAFGASMRTSQIPIYLAMFVLFFVAWRRTRRTGGPAASARLQVLAAVTFAIGCSVGHLALVTPLEIRGAEGSTHHLVMHPLVLGLSQPESDLSRREGLAWDDAKGEEIALRIDPRATFLSDRYEPALARYYVTLWRQHPAEMIGVYVAKLQFAGTGVFEDIGHLLGDRALPRAASEWISRRSLPGSALVTFATLMAIASWQMFRRTGSLPAFAWTLLNIAAVGTLIESIVIMPRFQVIYHSPLLLYLLLTPIFVAQVIVDRVGRTVTTEAA